MAQKTKLNILVIMTLSLFIIHVALSYVAGTDREPKLFPNTVGNVSDHFKLLVTPVGATFSIWGVIYFLQFAWLLYCVSTICRSGDATEILSGKFYTCFIISTFFITGWLFSWTRKEVVSSFIVIIINQIFIELSVYYACSDLHDFEASHEVTENNKADVWCQRILVQNGLLFYATWTAVATLLNAAILLNQEVGASDQTASLTVLIILTVFTILWFYMEGFLFQGYTDYTVSVYLALIYALSGIFSNAWDNNDAVGGLTLALLIVVIILLIVRIVLICVRPSRGSSYDSISYNRQSDTVNA